MSIYTLTRAPRGSDICQKMDSSSNTTLINFTAMLLPGVHGGGQAAGGLQQVPVVLFWLPADRQVRPG